MTSRTQISALLVVTGTLLAVAGVVAGTGCARNDLTMRAPGKIEQAVTVAGVANDLGATATLVHKGGAREADVKLGRGDDGVTFSGFVPASPGEYTLEVTFDGVVTADVAVGKGQRHFLGRLTSDSFTVTQGATATPTFTKAVDTKGGAADHGDDDNDGLGFLDELLLGTDPQKDDTDGDGVKDGDDCKPTDAGDRFKILAGGSVDDCDGDGFNSITALLGAKGIDCDDEDPATNPGVHDDCLTTKDEDCNPQTCPDNDITGPTVELIAPADGSTIGCNAPFEVHATDASDVASVLLTAVGHPFQGGTDRVLAMNDAHDHLTWNAPDGFGLEGTGLADGAFPVDVTARDNRGNPTTIHANFTLAIAFPSVTMTGPSSILDGDTAHIVVTPTGSRPLTKLELRASAFNPATSTLDLTTEQTLATLPIAGGSADVAASSLPANAVVYPVAVDDVGNTAAPNSNAAVFNTTLGINTAFTCVDTPQHIPAIAKRAGAIGKVTVLAHLQEAIDLVHTHYADAFVTEILATGIDAQGFIDLSRTDDASVFIRYDFQTPESVSAAGCTDASFDCSAQGPSVFYWSAAQSTLPSPQYVDNDNDITWIAIQHPDTIADSDAVSAAWNCGTKASGSSSDNIQYLRDVSGAIPNTDEVDIHTALDRSFTTDANNLSSASAFCCDSTGCT